MVGDAQFSELLKKFDTLNEKLDVLVTLIATVIEDKAIEQEEKEIMGNTCLDGSTNIIG